MNHPDSSTLEALKKLHEDSEKRKAEETKEAEQKRERERKAKEKEKRKVKEGEQAAKRAEKQKQIDEAQLLRELAAKKRKEEQGKEKRLLQEQRALKPEERQHLVDSLKRPVYSYGDDELPDHCARATGKLVHTQKSAIKELQLNGFDKLGCTWASITESGILECGPCAKINEPVELPDSQWSIPAYYDGLEIRPFPIPPPDSFWLGKSQLIRWGSRSDDSLFKDALSNYRGSVSHHPWLGYYPIDYLTRCLGHQEPAVVKDQVFSVFASALEDIVNSEAISRANSSIVRLGLFDGDIFYDRFFDDPEKNSDGWTKFNDDIIDEGDEPILSDCLRDSPSCLSGSDPRHRWLELIPDPQERLKFRRELQELLLECFISGREFERAILGEKSKERSARSIKLKQKGDRDGEVEKREKAFEDIIELRLQITENLDRFGPATVKKFLREEERYDLLKIFEESPKTAFKNYLQSRKSNSK